MQSSARNTSVLLSVLISLLYASLLIAGTVKMSDLPTDLQTQLQGTQHALPGLRFVAGTKSYSYSAPQSDGAFQSNVGEHAPASLQVTAGGSEFSVQLIPMIAGLGSALRAGDAISYTTPEGLRLTYTFKRNGVKEDIVLSHSPSDDLALGYALELDSSLVARLDDRGNLLIYGPDDVLSGSIQTGDEKSAALVMKARKNAPKTHLLYALPAPVVIDAGGKQYRDRAYYSINSNVLVVHTRDLSALEAPVTIDPSVVVTTTSDFAKGNNEGMISFDTNAISRAVPSGGWLGSWAGTSSFTTARYGNTSVAYNGFIYVLGGYNGGSLSDVQFAPINGDGTLGSWTPTTSFNTGRREHTSVAYNGYLYVLGGETGFGGLHNDVQFAPINADGTLGAWTSTTAFMTARTSHTSVVYNGFLYVIGGYNFSYLNDVQFAPIHANGTVGSWTTTIPFTTGRGRHSSVAYNGYLYVIGGENGSNLSDVQFAAITSDGTLGSWFSTASLPVGRYGHASVAYNGYLYVIGGNSGSTLNNVQVAVLNSGGTVGPWNSTTAFTNGRYLYPAVAYRGYLYIAGGNNGGSFYNDVQVASIQSFGMTGGWTGTTGLPTPHYEHTSVAYNGYLYIIGGSDGNTALNDVLFASIHADGTIGSWNVSYGFPNARFGHTSLVYGGNLYVIGGEGTDGLAHDDIQYTYFNYDGNVNSSWSTFNFPTARYGHSSVAYNGYLYIIGGFGAGNFLNDISFAPFNSNGGAVGAWSTATNTFTTGRYGHTSVAYNGYLYVIGGSRSGTNFNDVLFAPIQSNGDLGAWNETFSFPTARYGHSSVVYNGNLYIMGGFGNGGFLNDVQYAPLNLNGSPGSWNQAPSFTNVRYYHTTVSYNGYFYICGGLGAGYFSDVQFAAINFHGTVGAWSTTTSLPDGRYHTATVAYNGYLYVLGGYEAGYLDSVLFAPINADGTVGSWAETNPFSGARGDMASVAYNGYIYILGGNGMSDVQFAPINADGTVGGWFTGLSLPSPRSDFPAVAYNGYMYLLGGYSHSDVQFAAINANGQLVSWNATTPLPSARDYVSAFARNGYMYIVGGYDTHPNNDVYFAPINADGTIGTWTATTSFRSLPNYSSAVEDNGYLYVIASTGVVESAPFHSDGTLGCWTETTSAQSTGLHQEFPVYKGYIYDTAGFLGYGTLQFANLNGPSDRGVYSKLVDLGSTRVVNSIQFGGTGNGKINMTYATAADDATSALGARTTISNATTANPYSLGSSCRRYVWASFDLNDAGVEALDGGGFSRKKLFDFTINYSAGSPSINSVTDADTCAYSGIRVNYANGGGETSDNLVEDGSVVASGYTSNAIFNPHDVASHSYDLRPVAGVCSEDTPPVSIADVNNSPAAPANTLGGGKFSTTHVHMSWPAISGATSYNVKRCNAGGGACTPVLLVNTSVVDFFDNVLNDGQNYWYKIDSVNGSCVSCSSISNVEFLSHIANIGWASSWASSGQTAGTPGGNQFEAIRITVPKCSIAYQAHVANVGWQPEVSNGAVAGTTGQGNALQAIKIRLTGAEANVHVCYTAYVQNQGWQAEVCDGAQAGTTGQGLAIQALQIRIVTN